MKPAISLKKRWGATVERLITDTSDVAVATATAATAVDLTIGHYPRQNCVMWLRCTAKWRERKVPAYDFEMEGIAISSRKIEIHPRISLKGKILPRLTIIERE